MRGGVVVDGFAEAFEGEEFRHARESFCAA